MLKNVLDTLRGEEALQRGPFADQTVLVPILRVKFFLKSSLLRTRVQTYGSETLLLRMARVLYDL